MSDITDLAHDRDADGELLPVTESVEIRGETYRVDIYPATTGERNEWLRRFEDESVEGLSDDTTDDLLSQFLAELTPADFGADSWTDVRPAVTSALSDAVMARLFDAGDADEFRAALEAEGGQGN
jgi:hypothetical protein